MEDYRQVSNDPDDKEEDHSQPSSLENAAFLGEDSFYPQRSRERRFRPLLNYVFHGLALVVNTAFFLLLWQRTGVQRMLPDRLVYSPAQEAIQYTALKWDHTNIYFRNGSVNAARTHKGFGPPSKESDQAWEELLQYQNIRLNEEELGEVRGTPDLVEFSDGSGYYATLSAYHSLHCIKRLHHLMYVDHYYPNTTDRDKMLITHHAEHCLNILLQSVMCNADLSIIAMEWGATTRVPIGLDEGHHQCTDWSRIDNWMKQRSVDVFQPGLVVHPTLGEAYPNGMGDEIGIALDTLLGTHGPHSH